MSAQLPLFTTKAARTRYSARPAPPSRAAFLPTPEPAPSQEAFLAEIVTDWWATLDPRNWKGDGPSDPEVLARYAVTGTEADDWPNVSGSRMYTLVWPTLKHMLDTAPEALIEAVHTAIRLHGKDALKTTREMVTGHLEHVVRTGAWDRWAADSLATLERLSRFLGRPVPALPTRAAQMLPARRLELEIAVLHAQADAAAEELRADARRQDPPRRGRRRAQHTAEDARRHLDALRQALDRTTALLEDPERLPPLPAPEPPTAD